MDGRWNCRVTFLFSNENSFSEEKIYRPEGYNSLVFHLKITIILRQAKSAFKVSKRQMATKGRRKIKGFVFLNCNGTVTFLVFQRHEKQINKLQFIFVDKTTHREVGV